MLLEISAEETDVGEMKLPCHLLDALRAALELHLELQNHVLVNDGFGSVPRYLTHDICKILGRDIHLSCIIIHISRNLKIPFQQHHKPIEQFSYPIRLHFIRMILRIALKILMKTDEERL